jgi:dsDNA-binding SOS-regulon protein
MIWSLKASLSVSFATYTEPSAYNVCGADWREQFMAVMVKYVVVRDGKEDMIFTTKQEADAYDKMLDIAERLYAFLRGAELDIAEDTLDALTFFMAQHRDPIGKLLKGGKLETSKAGAKPTASAKDKGEEPVSSEPKGSETPQHARTTKSKAAA